MQPSSPTVADILVHVCHLCFTLFWLHWRSFGPVSRLWFHLCSPLQPFVLTAATTSSSSTRRGSAPETCTPSSWRWPTRRSDTPLRRRSSFGRLPNWRTLRTGASSGRGRSEEQPQTWKDYGFISKSLHIWTQTRHKEGTLFFERFLNVFRGVFTDVFMAKRSDLLKCFCRLTPFH